MSSLILKCILLAKGHVNIATAPIDEYAMSSITQDFNNTHFEATVLEGRMNSVLISNSKMGIEASSFSTRDFEQVSLSTILKSKKYLATIDCEITK